MGVTNPSDESPSAEQLQQWDCENVWHAFTQMAEYQPFLIERAEGCFLYDIEGRRYLDGVSSLWCNVHGHRHPHLNAAIAGQLDAVAHVTSLGVSNPTTIRLAKRLAELSPAGLEHVFFSSDGASAVEAALKMAFQYWRQRENPQPQKTKYIAYAGAYHGDTIGAVSVGGVARFHAMFNPLLFEVLRLSSPQVYRAAPEITAENACEHYLQELEQLLKEQHQEIAALVIEPLAQGAAGMITHPPGYLRGVRELTRRYDVLLIADEVAVGMGRTGTLFACEQEEVAPDLLAMGKGLTGGYLPMAATLASSEIWRAFLGEYHEYKTFFHGHTYGGNPLAAAAALATLEVFENESVLEALPAKAARLNDHLTALQNDHPWAGAVRQRGLLAGVELVSDRANKEPKTPKPYRHREGLRIA